MGTNDAFVTELLRLLIAVEAPALSLAVTPRDAWWILVLSDGICGLDVRLCLPPLSLVVLWWLGLERSSGFCVGRPPPPKERALEGCLWTTVRL